MANRFSAFRLQERPAILVCALPGRWLLERTTPSWRIKDPVDGFQRVVSEERARAIAVAVLDQGRTFPNAIVLATDQRIAPVGLDRATVEFPKSIRFLVVDGQHRLWAQKFAQIEALYCCLVHFDLNERAMAKLFVEINDNQKRVPASLRWDLIRLVRPEDEVQLRTADLCYALAVDEDSPLFQRVDMTGEQPRIQLKQASLAPGVKTAISARGNPLREVSYEIQLRVLKNFLEAVRSIDRSGWDTGESVFYGARVLRALLRLLPDLTVGHSTASLARTTAGDFRESLVRIRKEELDPEQIRASQGAAGIKAIYDTIREQVFGAE